MYISQKHFPLVFYDISQFCTGKKFIRHLKLTASRVGHLVNYASLASDVGVSAVTIKEWIAVLEATYILIRLEPYFENFGKRLIKAPKLYLADTGLIFHLLGIDTVG